MKKEEEKKAATLSPKKKCDLDADGFQLGERKNKGGRNIGGVTKMGPTGQRQQVQNNDKNKGGMQAGNGVNKHNTTNNVSSKQGQNGHSNGSNKNKGNKG